MRAAALGRTGSSPGRVGLRTLADAVLLFAGMLLAYFILPLNRPFSGLTALSLIGGLVCVAALLGWQVRLIARAPFPRLQAIKAFAMIVPLFLVLFSTAYYLIEYSTPGSFSQPLTRSDALYFTVTVFSTVGFGDIVARSEPARLVVTVQMAAGLVLVGAAARLVVDAVRVGVRRREGADGAADGSSEAARPEG